MWILPCSRVLIHRFAICVSGFPFHFVGRLAFVVRRFRFQSADLVIVHVQKGDLSTGVARNYDGERVRLLPLIRFFRDGFRGSVPFIRHEDAHGRAGLSLLVVLICARTIRGQSIRSLRGAISNVFRFGGSGLVLPFFRP